MPKPLVFVVEDDPSLGNLFADVMRDMGLETQLIQDGKQATERLEAAVPDMVLLDLHLPHVSGLDILDQIRKDTRLEKTRVAMITADSVRVKAAQGKADLILIKPIGFFDLRDMVTKLLPEHALPR
ncbi:MAG: response regulator [Anaerolineae bacterium]